jgi:hypothetical protein
MQLFDYVSAGPCDGTGPIAGLTKQVLDTLTADLAPGALVDISAHVHMISPTTIPLLQKHAAEALIAAVQEKGQKPDLFHALRVLPQQYAFHYWYKHDRCEQGIAAAPSRSKHEGADAIDIKDHNSWINVLKNHEWRWFGPNDKAHFTYYGAENDSDFVTKNVLAFQKLWNKHNPNDVIKEDGVYGDHTETRLKASPIAGF